MDDLLCPHFSPLWKDLGAASSSDILSIAKTNVFHFAAPRHSFSPLFRDIAVRHRWVHFDIFHCYLLTASPGELPDSDSCVRGVRIERDQVIIGDQNPIVDLYQRRGQWIEEFTKQFACLDVPDQQPAKVVG